MTYSWETFGFHIPEILVPAEGTDYYQWATIACDQYTSEPAYWEAVEALVGSAPSTLRLMLPEIFLGEPDEAERIRRIHETMNTYLTDGTLRALPPGCMLIRRTVEGRSRLGLLIATDLDRYDFRRGSHALTRATEETVVERIPPRLRIRKDASIEVSHIVVFIDDPEHTVIEPLLHVPQTPVYDADLMMNGGHVRCSFIADNDLAGEQEALSALFDKAVEKYGVDNVMLQATGDGNHSLATAKAHWEELKKTLSPAEAAVHPARYALIEIQNIHDPAIVFEPIYRVLFGAPGQTGEDLLPEIVRILDQQNGSARLLADGCDVPEGAFELPFVNETRSGSILVQDPAGELEVAVLQDALDVFVREFPGAKVDYIHGAHTVETLGSQKGNLGFFLPSMDKYRLFPAVAAGGALPRKTFSIGKSIEKRYYIECRRIGAGTSHR